MAREVLTGRNVVPITKRTFPLGQPVLIESFIDGNCGWEYDAPLHFMRPFHRYCIVGSCCTETIDGKIEDIIIDLDCGRTIAPDDDCWPYEPKYLKRLFRRARNGNRCMYFRSIVTVNSWSDDGYCLDFSCETLEGMPER